MQDLLQHIKCKHNADMEVRTKTFATMAEYQKWTEEEERRSDSHYVKKRVARIHGQVKQTYLYCSR